MDAPQITKKYEGLFLTDNNYANKDWDAVANHVHELLQKHNAAILSSEKWGERKLAYKVKGQKRGTYLLIRFNAPPGAITHIKQGCLLSEIVLRSLIVSDFGLEVPPPEETKEATIKEEEVKAPPSIVEEEEPAEVKLEEIS